MRLKGHDVYILEITIVTEKIIELKKTAVYVLRYIARFDCCRVFEIMTIFCNCLYGDGNKLGNPKIVKDARMTNKSLYRKCVSGAFASD